MCTIALAAYGRHCVAAHKCCQEHAATVVPSPTTQYDVQEKTARELVGPDLLVALACSAAGAQLQLKHRLLH
jgi:hypothetical protein